MATAPKSNASATAIWSAMKDAREGRTVPVPKHLRDGHYPGAKQLGHGQGYRSAHSSASGSPRAREAHEETRCVTGSPL